jgi:hypothetical protein
LKKRFQAEKRLDERERACYACLTATNCIAMNRLDLKAKSKTRVEHFANEFMRGTHGLFRTNPFGCLPRSDVQWEQLSSKALHPRSSSSPVSTAGNIILTCRANTNQSAPKGSSKVHGRSTTVTMIRGSIPRVLIKHHTSVDPGVQERWSVPNL